MIDINEMRRLTQEATPGPWEIVAAGNLPNGAGTPHPFHMVQVSHARFVRPEGRSDMEANANAIFIAAASPAAIAELLDRLEAAETAWKEADKACRDLTEKVIPSLRENIEAAEKERDWHAERCEDAMTECDAMRVDKTTLQLMMYSLKDRLEAVESDGLEQARLLGMSGEREAALLSKLEAAEKERDALRAKIERMDEAMESLLIRCDDSDSAMYGTLSTSFVRDTVRIARGAKGEEK